MKIIFRTELPSSPQQPLGLASSQPQVIILITLLILNLKVIDDGNTNCLFQPQVPFLTNAAGKPVARVTPVTSVGADATPPKPKPPPLTPKPAPSEIVKRLSFKRDAAPEPSFKRDAPPEVASFKREAIPESSFKSDVVPDSSFKRDVAPDSSLKRDAPTDSSFKREASPADEEKREVAAKKAGVIDEKTTSNSINHNENRRSLGEQQVEVKPDPKVGGFLDEPPDKPPPEPPNTNQPNESTKV